MIEIMLALMFPYLWAGTPEDGYYKVFLEEVSWGDTWISQNAVITNSVLIDNQTLVVSHINGMYAQMKFPDSPYVIHKIEILEDRAFSFNPVYCSTTWDHEWFHSMGYQHGEWPLVTC